MKTCEKKPFSKQMTAKLFVVTESYCFWTIIMLIPKFKKTEFRT